MPTFILDNQALMVTVKTAAELVTIMHANALAPAADDKAYMEDVAERAAVQNGSKIRTYSAEAFVNDLVEYKMLEVAP